MFLAETLMYCVLHNYTVYFTFLDIKRLSIGYNDANYFVYIWNEVYMYLHVFELNSAEAIDMAVHLSPLKHQFYELNTEFEKNIYSNYLISC